MTIPPSAVFHADVTHETDIISSIVELGTQLDLKNISEYRRWILLPPIAVELLRKSELKEIFGNCEDHGRLGMVDRFTVFGSPLIDLNIIYAGQT